MRTYRYSIDGREVRTLESHLRRMSQVALFVVLNDPTLDDPDESHRVVVRCDFNDPEDVLNFPVMYEYVVGYDASNAYRAVKSSGLLTSWDVVRWHRIGERGDDKR